MQHDKFIVDCELKTRQLLRSTAKVPTPPMKRVGKKKPAAAMKARKPIEREFYKMRHASKQKFPTKDNATPPLKSSVLRKMYRCDEKTILDKQKRASRMQAKFEHLQKRHQNVDEEEGSSSSDSYSDEEDTNSSHVIHDVLDSLVENENRLSLKRAAQLEAVYTPNVKLMWEELEQTEEGKGATESSEDGNTGKEGEVLQREKELTRPIPESAREDAPNDLCLSTMGISVTGRATAANTTKICPGRKPIGKSGIWRLNTPIPADEMQSESALFHWPSPSEIKYPEYLDMSRASSYFYSKPVGRDGETCVTVLNSLEFKSPILAPFCYAASQGFVVPPFSQHECVSGTIPHITFPGTSLMATKVDSRLDALLRQAIIVVDPAATSKDHMYPTRSPNSLDEFDENGFRRMTFADAIEYDDTISTRSFGISSAIPNEPIVSPPFTHTSQECCVEYFSRKRTADDYHYIAESDGEGTHSEPYLFVSHMSAYHPRYVSKMSITEQRRRVLAAKESESRKLNGLSTSLRLEGAEQLAKQRLAQRVEKLKDSVKPDTAEHARQQATQTACVPFSLVPDVLQLTGESQTNSIAKQSIVSNSTPRVVHNPIGKRNVERGMNESKLKKLDDSRKLATSRATPTCYESQFATKTHSLFIRDLTTERLKLSKSRGNQRKTEDSILSEIQKQNLNEILEVPVLTKSDAAAAATTRNAEEENRNPVTKAILAIKNHNYSALEQVLDSEGDLDINTRDQHGNTLFILACQQGSKKLAKFLLRRGSDMNAQNHAGNTALHYLNEYNHTNLAAWLVRKGADDKRKNLEGLTAYEGVIFDPS